MTATGPEQQVGGSSLPLAGRFLYIGITLAVPVLIVRALSQEDYGAFAYALAIILLIENFSHLGLNRPVPRFAAIDHEQDGIERLFGTILLVLTTVVAVGAHAVRNSLDAIILGIPLLCRLIGAPASPAAPSATGSMDGGR